MFVYSTLTNALQISEYVTNGGGVPTKKRSVMINGGSNIATKHLITPQGVVTDLSDSDYEFVKDTQIFKRMLSRGFIKVDSKKVDVEKVAADMESRDESAPFTPQDYQDANGAKPTGSSAELPLDKPKRGRKKGL
jgi:hypothetical protein